MSDGKRKYETNTHSIQDATLVPRQGRGKDLADIQPIGYLSGLKPDTGGPLPSRDMILRLIATLKEK